MRCSDAESSSPSSTESTTEFTRRLKLSWPVSEKLRRAAGEKLRSREVGDKLTELSSSTCATGRLLTSCRREADKSWSSPCRPAQPGGWRRAAGEKRAGALLVDLRSQQVGDELPALPPVQPARRLGMSCRQDRELSSGSPRQPALPGGWDKLPAAPASVRRRHGASDRGIKQSRSGVCRLDGAGENELLQKDQLIWGCRRCWEADEAVPNRAIWEAEVLATEASRKLSIDRYRADSQKIRFLFTGLIVRFGNAKGVSVKLTCAETFSPPRHLFWDGGSRSICGNLMFTSHAGKLIRN